MSKINMKTHSAGGYKILSRSVVITQRSSIYRSPSGLSIIEWQPQIPLIPVVSNRPLLVCADEKRFLLAIDVVSAVYGGLVCGFAEG